MTRYFATGVHYPVPLHLHPAFDSGQRSGDLPNAERACREIVLRPPYPGMSESAVAEVADAIARA